LREHLDRWTAPGADSWVFTGPKGGPLRDGVWQQEWVRARERVGLRDLHFHDLRHVAATLTAATGAGVKEIMHRLGHSSAQAALRYQHATPARDRTIADAISRLIQAAKNPPELGR
jgi:integrase